MGIWLSDRGREGQATQAPPAAPPTPVFLAKSVVSTEPAAPAAVPADGKAAIVPEAVARRFLKIEQEYYFPDRTPAFSDRGQTLVTRDSHPEVVRSLVEIAKARGWDTITVKGADDFRRSAWMEAAQNGLKVIGYQPTSLDQAELANRPANNTVERGAVREKSAAPAQKQTAAQAAEASPVQPTVALQGAAAPRHAEDHGGRAGKGAEDLHGFGQDQGRKRPDPDAGAGSRRPGKGAAGKGSRKGAVDPNQLSLFA